MARRDRFDWRLRGEWQSCQHLYTRRVRKPLAWLGVGTVVCAAVAGFLVVDRTGGTAQAFLDGTGQVEGRLVTTFLDTEELERDSLGQFSFEGLGARAPRLVPVALRDEISLLRGHRDRVRDRHRLAPDRDPFRDLPIADDAPPRMDSGHPDPDRLLPTSRPVTESAQ